MLSFVLLSACLPSAPLELAKADAAEPVAASIQQEPVDFERDVRPILNAHCTGCHGGVKQAGGVSFVWEDQVLPPDGWAAIPGEPDESPMYTRLLETDPEIRMPPPHEHPKPLPADEIETIRRWIAEGANWKPHWSLQRPVAPPVPKVEARTPVDAFVRARLNDEGITPAEPATPDRWLRRVTLDLTGLLPSPEEQAAFIEDVRSLEADGRDVDPAYARVVDRLLASPHYGQRWASVWLDQMRYADSKGLGHDFRRTMWPYRDWVVDAINADMPFDEFTRRQLAGDLLPGTTDADLVATAAQRLTATNDEGGTDDEQFRIEAVIDRTNTTWTVWQAMSFGCAQCHDHPYDPITHAEYYEFLAFYNNTQDVDLVNDAPNVDIAQNEADAPRLQSLRAELHDLREQLWTDQAEAIAAAAWQPVEEMDAWADKMGMAVESITRDGVTQAEAVTVGTVPKHVTIKLTATLPDDLAELGGVRVTGLPKDVAAAVANPEWGFTLSYVTTELVGADGNARLVELADVVGDEPHPRKPPRASLDASQTDQGFAAFTRIHRPRSAVLIPKHSQDIQPGDRLRVTMKFNEMAHGSFPLVMQRSALAVTGDPDVQRMADDAEVVDRLTQMRRLRAAIRDIPRHQVAIMQDLRPEQSRPTHRFSRGNMFDKAEAVQPGTPDRYGAAADRGDRAGMADWLLTDNPLTARVTVNRLWARLFGRGLVATEEDFGSTGERPSHPQLLDHLAVTFERDWSQKSLLRSLVLTDTYRQSSELRPELAERDPMNALLARGPRHRLPAETIRDAMLHAVGLLDETMRGAPVHPPVPDGSWAPFSPDPYPTPAIGEPNRHRQSLYGYVKRTVPFPMFASFDAPSREFCASRRVRSNTPLQSLMTLNDEVWVEAGDALAESMRAAPGSRADQIASGFRRLLTREPTESELATLGSLADRFGESGLRRVATVLLNLDEAITK